MLYRITIIVSLFLVLWHSPAEGQARLRFGPELGVSVSRLPWGKQFDSPVISYHVKENMLLYAGPLVGGQAQLELGKHWQFAVSLRYQQTGEAYKEVLTTNTILLKTAHRYTFHRLSMPVTLGYRLGNVAVSAGIQPSWFMSGKYSRTHELERAATIPAQPTTLRTWNLLQGEAWWHPTDRFSSQLHLSLAYFPTERLKVSIDYNTAGQFVYTKFVPSPFDGCDCIFPSPVPRTVEHRFHDLSLSMVYFLGTQSARIDN